MNALELPLIARLRQNHSLEHATMHILAQRFPQLPLAGRTTLDGFYIYGAPDGASVESAAQEALRRLLAGEPGLATHPHCGTGLAIAGLLAGILTFIATLGKGRLRKLPRAILAATLAVVAAQPLGLIVQERITTALPSPSLSIGKVRFIPTSRGISAHKVTLVEN